MMLLLDHHLKVNQILVLTIIHCPNNHMIHDAHQSPFANSHESFSGRRVDEKLKILYSATEPTSTIHNLRRYEITCKLILTRVLYFIHPLKESRRFQRNKINLQISKQQPINKFIFIKSIILTTIIQKKKLRRKAAMDFTSCLR
jgi:hypothetical protein